MCGLSGFIGKSKNQNITYQLITKLFEKSDSRGIDASGFWGVEENGKVLYHKEPGRSSLFVKKDEWKQTRKYNTDLLLVHARGASKGFGEPSINLNNHPFTSFDKSVGLIHNGRMDDKEFTSLKSKYKTKGNCDSEILLRIIEAGEYYGDEQLKDFEGFDYPHRLAGIRDVFSFINEGHMAVALGERFDNGERALWLFRNRYRPLWLIDMRDYLGQIFFVSDPLIWHSSVKECGLSNVLIKDQKLVELPPEEIWFIKHPEKIYKFKIKKTKPAYVFDNIKCDLIRNPRNFEVITTLDDEDKVTKTPLSNVNTNPLELYKKCNKMIDLINDIKNNINESNYVKMNEAIELEILNLEKLKNETLI